MSGYRYSDDLKRGPITPDEREEIVRLAETMANPTAARVARKLNRHPATIAWQMMRLCVCDRSIRYGGPASYIRKNGAVVHRFDQAEDRRLCELRAAGRSQHEIAAILNSEFGRARKAHSINVRLAMLAAYEGGPESEVA